jgi:hypothetical protein
LKCVLKKIEFFFVLNDFFYIFLIVLMC